MRVWGKDTHVDFDRGLAYCLSQIRTALGDSGDNPRFVQTIPKRGFKFIAPIVDRSRQARRVRRAARAAPESWQIGLGLAGFDAVRDPRVVAGSYSRRTPPAIQVVIARLGLRQRNRTCRNTIGLVAGLSDLVVERLTKLDPGRIAVIGNAAILRQPRNIRNLKAVADDLKADYVLLGQLQQGESRPALHHAFHPPAGRGAPQGQSPGDAGRRPGRPRGRGRRGIRARGPRARPEPSGQLTAATPT